MTKPTQLGISGRLARTFFRAEITPLLALVALLMGIFATLITPKEEDPQIDVTFANVFIAYPGASAKEVETLVATPAEKILSEMQGLDHLYSASQPGMAVLSVQFKVGEKRTDALVRLYNKLYSNQDWLPQNLGVMPPIVKPKGIDDVPVLTLTLTGSETTSRYELNQVANAIIPELKRVKGTKAIDTVGAPDAIIKVTLDTAAMAAKGIAINDLAPALMASNTAATPANITQNNHSILVQAGTFLSSPDEVAQLVVGLSQGSPVYLRDIATVEKTADIAHALVNYYQGQSKQPAVPAITIAIAKQSGVNAADVVNAVTTRIEQLKQHLIPDNVTVTVTRDYGQTATDKANHLIQKLFLVTLVVIALVWFALGKREAFVVGAAVIVTLMVTLFLSWAFGFTINRVSLFALIFSIGILVDDAIVVVENIHRHMALGKHSITQAIPIAVDEVGGPTILATFTVIAALLPMAFVSGLMGPYMSPIPINASAGMFVSLLVAFIFTPWLMYKVLKTGNEDGKHHELEVKHETAEGNQLHRFMRRIMLPFLKGEHSRKKRHTLYLTMILLIIGSMFLVVTQHVILKMLPFDNKSEFQVVVDMPEGTPLEQTNKVLDVLANYLQQVPEVTNIETYAGTSSPINFNGLVRQYYLRALPNQGDIQVNLKDKAERDRESHAIALSVREPLQQLAKPFGANVKIVEVPPGPPVMAPIVAEIYGTDYAQQMDFAKTIEQQFSQEPGVVDIDTSIEADTPKVILSIDRAKAARLGVAQKTIVDALQLALSGTDASYLHRDYSTQVIPIRLRVSEGNKADIEQMLQLKVRNQQGQLIALRDIVSPIHTNADKTIYHKDLLPVVYVTADGAGETDSPLYGMFGILSSLKEQQPELEQALTSQPENPYIASLKWDGEWQITYETFRDMGIAYAVGLIAIFLLIVGQFRSYAMPLVIMAPIPLTLIGIMPGHALFGAQFTATSMIGMIALAGIIVRNSILLVDFINLRIAQGAELASAVIDAAATRTRPILLTAIAAILDAIFILDDPIFNGLAVSLITGVFVSTLLTLVVIPILYYSVRRRKHQAVNV